MRAQEMRNSARLRVDHQQHGEGNEIEQITTSPAQHESGHQQREQVAVRREPEPEQPNRDPERDGQPARHKQRRAAIQVLARWAPPLGGLAVALAVLVRLPFWNAPLTADEGGYAEVARLWSHGATLYGGAWVDRPQGLILVFRALHLFGGSPLAMRAAAAVVAALVVAATMLLTLRLARGRITAVTAGLLAATVGTSPFIESFTLSGELLASLPAVLSLLCFCLYLERSERAGPSNSLFLGSTWPQGRRWSVVQPVPASNRLLLSLVGAGVLTGIAVLIKQSAFDAGLAAVVYLLWRERRRGLAPAAVLVAGALVPVAIAAASAARLSAWLYAVVGYRFDGDSLLTGSLSGRAHEVCPSPGRPPTSRRRRSGRPIRTLSTTLPSRATCARTRSRVSECSRSGPTRTSTTSPTAVPPFATSGRATLRRSRAPSRPSATHWRREGRSPWSSSSPPRSSIRAAAPPLCYGASTAVSLAQAARPSTEARATDRRVRPTARGPRRSERPGSRTEPQAPEIPRTGGQMRSRFAKDEGRGSSVCGGPLHATFGRHPDDRKRPSRSARPRRLVSPARGRLPPRPLRAGPRHAARPDRRHAGRADPLRHAQHLRGRRGPARARPRAGARPLGR